MILTFVKMDLVSGGFELNQNSLSLQFIVILTQICFYINTKSRMTIRIGNIIFGQLHHTLSSDVTVTYLLSFIVNVDAKVSSMVKVALSVDCSGSVISVKA